MKDLVIAKNPFEPETWEHLQVEDVRAALMNNFESWPSTARIYDGYVSTDHDVTPCDEASINHLEQLKGPIFVVVYPADPVTIIIAVIALAAVITFAILFKPKIPGTEQQSPHSPNNRLGARNNEARPNGRIPDIFGTVKAIPDLLTVPYRIYEDGDEVEYVYMCIGRGSYVITNVKEGTTPYTDLIDDSVDIYAPNTSPNYGSPQQTIGTHIARSLYHIKRFNSVDGQELLIPNPQFVNSNGTLYAYYPNEARLVGGGSDIDFSELFRAGDVVNVANIWTGDGEGGVLYDHAGQYTIQSVTSTSIFFTTNWLNNQGPGWSLSCWVGASITGATSRWDGSYLLDDTTATSFSANFVAPQGLYYVIDGAQHAGLALIELGVTPVDVNGNPTGAEQTAQGTIPGSTTSKAARGITIILTPTFSGRCKVRARRITNRYYAGNVQSCVDTINWTDIYTTRPVTESHFGDVTTAFIRTASTPLSKTVKEREFNVIAQRKIKTRISGSTFTGTLSGTNLADEIFSHLCLDPKIGRRTVDDVDFDSVYAAADAAEANFHTTTVNQFNYTFDDPNTSFEESLAAVADVIFCKAYRRGIQIKLSFEKQTTDSTLLFNHRNKTPGSEIRSVRFGYVDDNDGLEFTYVDPTDEASVTYYLPLDQSATNPKKVESIGIRNKLQAHFHAWRIWNKMRYQNVSVEFEATQEADLLVLMDRILVADNTRPDTQDGEVISQNVLELTVSQDVIFTGGTYTIFLQHTDGTVESMGVTAGSTNRKVILAQAPRLSLALTPEYYARTTYVVIKNTSSREQAFLVVEKESKSNFTQIVKGINYKDSYYANDHDYYSGIVDINGNYL